MDFYKLVPKVVQLYDEETPSAIVEDILDVLQEEYDSVRDLISDFENIINPENDEYRKYILELVGGTGFSYTSIADWIAENIVFLHKISGTQQSWKKYWYWLLGVTVEIQELFKTELYENEDWSYPSDGSHSIKSSKIQMCYMSCETYSETLDVDWEDEYFEMVEDVAPIHIRLKPNIVGEDESDIFFEDTDSIGCPTCETVCETPYQIHDEVWEGSVIQGDLDDTFSTAEDTLEIEVTCIATCEVSCEECCETGCECDTCELFCETGCEIAQTHGPGYSGGGGGACDTQEESNSTCSAQCETQTCESGCQVSCENDCEDVCQHDCEFSCQADYCQHDSCQCNHTSGSENPGA